MPSVEVRPEILNAERPAFSFGMYLPRAIPNSEIETWGMRDIKGRLITAHTTFLRTGIERRFWADPTQTPYDLGFEAARKIIRPGQKFDSVIVSSSYPAEFNQADKLVEDFGLRANKTLEVVGACDGWAAILGQISLYPEYYGENIALGAHELYSKHCANLRELGVGADPTQAELAFSDIALMTVINRRKLELFKPAHYYQKSDDILLPDQGPREGNYWALKIPESPDHFRQNGPNVIDAIRKLIPEAVDEAISHSGYKQSEIAYVIPHPSSIRALDAISSRLPNLNIVNDVRDGYGSSAAIPRALMRLVEGDASYILRGGKEINGKFRLEEEQPFVMVGFGAGIYTTAMVAVMHR